MDTQARARNAAHRNAAKENFGMKRDKENENKKENRITQACKPDCGRDGEVNLQRSLVRN